jgi:hypothetical protein
MPILEEVHNMIANYYYKPVFTNNQGIHGFRTLSPKNSLGGNPRSISRGRYDQIIDENDHLLLNSYGPGELPKEFRRIQSKYGNAKERII